MPAPDLNAVTIHVPRWQFWTLISTIIGGFATVILVLVNIVYGGLKDEIKEMKESVQALSASYREAVTSGVKVQDLLTRAPTFERKIDERRIMPSWEGPQGAESTRSRPAEGLDECRQNCVA